MSYCYYSHLQQSLELIVQWLLWGNYGPTPTVTHGALREIPTSSDKLLDLLKLEHSWEQMENQVEVLKRDSLPKKI